MLFTEEELNKLKEKRSRPKWMKKLTAKDLQHLQEGLNMKEPTLRAFKLAREEQRKHSIDCRDCRRIAIKIGLEEPEG